MGTKGPIRLAIVGGRRGQAFNRALVLLKEHIELVAVCDVQQEVVDRWQRVFPDVWGVTDYNQLLESPRVDAVFIATPLPWHAAHSLQALRAGKHVLCEVTAVASVEDGWELIETVQSTGLTYMMAENYCFMRDTMQVLHMAEHDVFGELTFAECAYIHDVRNLAARDDGTLTWRGNMLKDWQAVSYPTHSIGPVAQWLGTGRKGRNRFKTIQTMMSQPAAAADYFKQTFGPDHPGAQKHYWQLGDNQVSLLSTARGAVVSLRTDLVSPRPHNMTHYGLQGTKAAYLSGRHEHERGLVWIDGRSPGSSLHNAAQPALWEPLHEYTEYEHPLWQKWGHEAGQLGHGGGDFFVLLEFAQAIKEQRPPCIDVYDAVTWSALTPLSAESIKKGGSSVAIPDFRRGAAG